MAEEKEKPLTRDDLLKLIEENGGKAKGLDLSERVFEAGVDLSKLNLDGIILSKAWLSYANLQKTSLRSAILDQAFLRDAVLEETNLQRAKLNGADLQWIHGNRANLHECSLYEADLQRASLVGANLQAAYLGGANLQGSTLEHANMRGVNLVSANLQRASLEGANLEEAELQEADLRGANLWFANLQRAFLWYTCLRGAFMWEANLQDSRLQDVIWGDYKLGEEVKPYFVVGEIRYRYDAAETAYRLLKKYHQDAGMYNIAGEFFYREMEAKRKGSKWQLWPPPLAQIRHILYWLLCGYGEKPWQVFASAAAVVLGLALIYFATGMLAPNTLLNSLYYSAVSFTALGYGSWAPQPSGWVKGFGAFEAFLGVFMMALFLVTFTRKMTR